MLSQAATKLMHFRKQLYSLFPKRRDAIMNLLDALTSQGHQCKSVVQLSNSPLFKRQYSSITDAIADGLPEANWSEIQRLVHQQVNADGVCAPHHFIIDCTGNPRPHARKLADRYITHTPNPAPGNKPIAVGHQFSVLTLLPNSLPENQKHWLMPLSALRVKSDEKGNEIGMTQLVDTIKSLGLSDEVSLSIGDTLYGTEACRVTASQQDNLIHLFRLNSKRNLFFAPTDAPKRPGETGRHKEFGAKMNLSDPSTQPPSDQRATTQWVSRKGKRYTVTLNGWNDMLLRGSRTFRSSQYPLNVIRVEVSDEAGKSLYKRPLWLAVFGKRRHELSLIDAYESYRSRYDVEHFFRFSKRNLLMDAYQTTDVTHEELWWSLCTLAYAQLYLAKGMVPSLPQPWERYLPAYKTIEAVEDIITTPSQTQRGFADVLNTIGSPAKECIARGKPRGRLSGETQPKREEQAVIFKTKKVEKDRVENVLLKTAPVCDFSDPQKIDKLIRLVHTSLGKLDITPSEFSKMLIDST